MHVAVASPKGYEADASIVKLSEEIAAQTGGKITITQDPLEAAKDADVIYTDVWASMGFEEEQAQREARLRTTR